MIKIVEPAIQHLLSGLAGGRVHPMRADQNSVAPFIIFQRTDSERFRAINGPSGLLQAFIQIDCYDSTYYGAKALGASVESILDGYRGTVYYGGNSPTDFVRIGGISCQGDTDIFDETDEPFLFRSFATYLVTYHQGE